MKTSVIYTIAYMLFIVSFLIGNFWDDNYKRSVTVTVQSIIIAVVLVLQIAGI